MVSFFHDIVRFFNDEGIPYMLTGSMAMGVYTVPRATQDFDFVVELHPEDIPALVRRFSEGYYCNADAIKDSLRRKSRFNIIDHESGFKADIIPLKENVFQKLQFSRRNRVALLDIEADVISAEDLILSKLMWIQQLQSGRQMEDIVAISRFPNLDWTYVHHWIAELNLHTFRLLQK